GGHPGAVGGVHHGGGRIRRPPPGSRPREPAPHIPASRFARRRLARRLAGHAPRPSGGPRLGPSARGALARPASGVVRRPRDRTGRRRGVGTRRAAAGGGRRRRAGLGGAVARPRLGLACPVARGGREPGAAGRPRGARPRGRSPQLLHRPARGRAHAGPRGRGDHGRPVAGNLLLRGGVPRLFRAVERRFLRGAAGHGPDAPRHAGGPADAGAFRAGPPLGQPSQHHRHADRRTQPRAAAGVFPAPGRNPLPRRRGAPHRGRDLRGRGPGLRFHPLRRTGRRTPRRSGGQRRPPFPQRLDARRHGV
ncbi:MAG: hypothetical protein AVDCRST_MAG04-1039, partial [uncultured Acetobacteraceae bacterium]